MTNLVKRWREEAEEYRRRGAFEAAQMLECCARDLEKNSGELVEKWRKVAARSKEILSSDPTNVCAGADVGDYTECADELEATYAALEKTVGDKP